jgi:hypothetical protein
MCRTSVRTSGAGFTFRTPIPPPPPHPLQHVPQDEFASLRRMATAAPEVEDGMAMRGFVPFSFAELTAGPNRREFATSAPPYRVCVPGLNMEGKCSNERCAAHVARHSVIVQVRSR